MVVLAPMDNALATNTPAGPITDEEHAIPSGSVLSRKLLCFSHCHRLRVNLKKTRGLDLKKSWLNYCLISGVFRTCPCRSFQPPASFSALVSPTPLARLPLYSPPFLALPPWHHQLRLRLLSRLPHQAIRAGCNWNRLQLVERLRYNTEKREQQNWIHELENEVDKLTAQIEDMRRCNPEANVDFWPTFYPCYFPASGYSIFWVQ